MDDKKKPGVHKHYKKFYKHTFNKVFKKTLMNLMLTDTIIATASR